MTGEPHPGWRLPPRRPRAGWPFSLRLGGQPRAAVLGGERSVPRTQRQGELIACQTGAARPGRESLFFPAEQDRPLHEDVGLDFIPQAERLGADFLEGPPHIECPGPPVLLPDV